MEPVKPQFNWQRMLVTLGIVLFAALVVGGTTWYVMDKSAKEIKAANDESVATLQKQIDDLSAKKISATPTTTPTTPPTTTLKTYTHKSPAFSLQYPATQTMTGDTPADRTVWLSTDGTRANTTLQITYEATKNIEPSSYFDSLVAANFVPQPYTINGYGQIGSYKVFNVDYNHQGKAVSVYYIYNNGYTYTLSYPGEQTETYLRILKTLQFN